MSFYWISGKGFYSLAGFPAKAFKFQDLKPPKAFKFQNLTPLQFYRRLLNS